VLQCPLLVKQLNQYDEQQENTLINCQRTLQKLVLILREEHENLYKIQQIAYQLNLIGLTPQKK